MWGFEASALAFIQFPGTLASTRELIAEAGVTLEGCQRPPSVQRPFGLPLDQ